MSLKNTKLFKLEEEETTEQTSVNPAELCNIFDIARANYFETNRTIFITGPITWELADPVIQKLMFYNDDSKAPVIMYISSPGGDGTAGFAIIDCMNELKANGIEVYTICKGICASMASIILACGTIGKRYAFPSSRIMVHQASIDNPGGTAKDIKITLNELVIGNDLMFKMLSKQTGLTTKELDELTGYDHYMAANEAKKYKLIDHIKTKLI